MHLPCVHHSHLPHEQADVVAVSDDEPETFQLDVQRAVVVFDFSAGQVVAELFQIGAVPLQVQSLSG